MDKDNSELTLLKTRDIDNNSLQQPEIEKLKLHEYAKASVEIDKVKLGCFVKFKGMLFNEPVDNIPYVSLVAFGNKDTSILDGCFLPLDFELKDGALLTINIANKSGTKEYGIGILRLLNPHLNIGRIVSSQQMVFNGWLGGKLTLKKIDIEEGSKVTLLLDGNPLLYGEKTKEILELTGIKYEFIVVRANGEDLIDVRKMRDYGVIYLSLIKTDGQEIKVPFARWLKEIKNVPHKGN